MIAQVQPVASPVAVLGEFAMAAPESEKAHTGAVVTSVAEVNVSDTTSALLALPVPEVAIATELSVGAVKSTVIGLLLMATEEASVAPALPAAST